MSPFQTRSPRWALAAITAAILATACQSHTTAARADAANGADAEEVDAATEQSPEERESLGRIELIFDDEDDLTGAPAFASINNLEGGAQPFFEGGSHRTRVTEGRYGRGAELVGAAGGIALNARFRPEDGLVFGMWVKNKVAFQKAWLFVAPDTLGVEIHKEEISLVYRQNGEDVTRDSGTRIPADEKYHYIRVTFRAATPTQAGIATIAVDFSPGVEIAGIPVLEKVERSAWIGKGFVGQIDEFILTDESWPWPRAQGFDTNPEDCGAARLSCIEETLLVTMPEWSWPVAVRFKSSFDPEQCNKRTRCPVVFVVSGGGICNDDYDRNDTVALADAGMVAVAIDPYCEVGQRWLQFPHETTEFLAVKNHIFEQSAVSSIVSGPEYAATGCSHGGRAVGAWAMFEEDYPARTFINSAGNVAPHCAYHHDQWMCDASRADFDRGLATPHPELNPIVSLKNSRNLISRISRDVARSRDIAMSWGTNTTQQPTCSTEGAVLCKEAGTGHTGGGRAFRDLWYASQDGASPTGFFMENDTQPCQHCIHPNSPANAELWSCAECFLKNGREAMATQCPACLSLTDGGTAPVCEIECNEAGCELGSGMTFP